MKNRTKQFRFLLVFLLILASCGEKKEESNSSDSTKNQSDSLEKVKPVTEESKTQEVNQDSLLKKQKEDSLQAVKELKKHKADSIKAAKENEVKLIAYYFHPTARCVTCRNIEAYAIEAIEKWKEANETPITWKELNIDDSVNEHYVKEYDLQFSSLVVAKFTGGKKTNWKNLEETWKLVNDKKAFIKYVDSELDNFITKQNKKD
jgi:hypothetical protein